MGFEITNPPLDFFLIVMSTRSFREILITLDTIEINIGRKIINV